MTWFSTPAGPLWWDWPCPLRERKVRLAGLGRWWNFGRNVSFLGLLGFIASGIARERKHSADPRGPPCSKDIRPRARAQVGGT